MLLIYNFKGQNCKVFIHWTADTGCSTVFREIVQSISDKHQLDSGGFHDSARRLDELTDRLYKQIYIFADEHYGVPYNPRFRKSILRVFSEISDMAEEYQKPDCSEHEHLLAGLFLDIVDKLRGTVDVYLAEHAYQCKFRERLRHKEQYIETTASGMLSYEFENVLLQMTDLSRMMDCLTEKQRQRLVKHIFLKYTLQEIAEQEGVNDAVVCRSIAAALKKLRRQMP